MNYRTVICVYYPHQLLPALVALMHYRRFCLHENVEQPTLIYVKILHDNEQGLQIAEAIKNMVKNIKWLSVKFSHSWKLGGVKEHYFPIKWRALRVRHEFKSLLLKDVFYAHDLSADFFTKTYMHAFPESKRICFGDSLGIVYSQDYFMTIRYSEDYFKTQKPFEKIKGYLSNWLVKLRRRWVLPKKQLTTDKAILILPCDPGGDFLKDVSLHVPTKEEVTEAIHLLSSHLSCVDQDIEHILNSSSKKITFFVLGNLNESKLASLDNELRLYQEIIDTQVPKDSILIIKPHPGTHHQTLSEFKRKLNHAEDIHYINEKFCVYPIELNQLLINKSHKILSISYASISIPYLYDRPVTHVLTNELITKYFNANSSKWVHEGNEQYIKMMHQIKDWDGCSPLIV